MRGESAGLVRSGLQLGEPAQGTQTGKEAVLAAPGDHEARQVLQAAPDGPRRDGDGAGSVVMAGHRVLLTGESDEVAVVDPLGLDELELPNSKVDHTRNQNRFGDSRRSCLLIARLLRGFARRRVTGVPVRRRDSGHRAGLRLHLQHREPGPRTITCRCSAGSVRCCSFPLLLSTSHS